jgi:hypothetical protein
MHENPLFTSRIVTQGQTDGHGEANRHIFATFSCERAWNGKYFIDDFDFMVPIYLIFTFYRDFQATCDKTT